MRRSDLQNLKREKFFISLLLSPLPSFLSLLIAKNTEHEELSSTRDKRRMVAEEAINNEREARRVAEEERRERKRRDKREIPLRERDEGRRRKTKEEGCETESNLDDRERLITG